MADKDKVQELLEATEMMSQYTAMTEQLAGQISARLTLEEDLDGAKVAKVHEKIYATMRNHMFDFVVRLYGDLFTNDEVDQIIEIARLPISMKMRALIPEL